MDFYEVVRTRRSIRSYRPDPIPEDALNRVLEAARIAPSGSNRQPWRFIVVKDVGLKKRLVPACGNQGFIAEAPMVIVACGRAAPIDVSIAFTHLILAARAEGLGTCWIGSFDNEKVKEVLGIPEGFNVVAVTPLGYPAGEGFREPSSRKPLSEIVSLDGFK